MPSLLIFGVDTLTGQELAIMLSWIASKLEVPSYLHFPELRLQVHLTMPGIFTLVLGIELRSPCLQDPLPIQLFLALIFFLSIDKVHVYDSKLVVGNSYLCPIPSWLSSPVVSRPDPLPKPMGSVDNTCSDTPTSHP